MYCGFRPSISLIINSWQIDFWRYGASDSSFGHHWFWGQLSEQRRTDKGFFFFFKISISFWSWEGSKIICSFTNFYLTLNILRWKSLAWEQFMQMELQETLMAGVRAPPEIWPAVIMANTFAGIGELYCLLSNDRLIRCRLNLLGSISRLGICPNFWVKEFYTQKMHK